MKNLKDVLEKLKIDDIKLIKEFPIDGTIDDMIEFLEKEGFKEIEYHKNYTLSKQIKNTNDKVFITLENKRIYFADTSKKTISKENPIFFIDIGAYMFSVYVDTHDNIVEDDKKAFMVELNKHFNWQ